MQGYEAPLHSIKCFFFLIVNIFGDIGPSICIGIHLWCRVICNFFYLSKKEYFERFGTWLNTGFQSPLLIFDDFGELSVGNQPVEICKQVVTLVIAGDTLFVVCENLS